MRISDWSSDVCSSDLSGAGQLTKMVNQICIAGLLQGLAEGMNFGQKAGLDMAQVIEVIGKGAAQSWQMDNRGASMCEGRFDFGFAVDWMRKDLGICLAEAKQNGARLPVTALVDQFYGQVQARGGHRWDTSSLMQLLAKDGGGEGSAARAAPSLSSRHSLPGPNGISVRQRLPMMACRRPQAPQSSTRKPLCRPGRSEEHTSELQSLMRISYAVFCLKKKINILITNTTTTPKIN